MGESGLDTENRRIIFMSKIFSSHVYKTNDENHCMHNYGDQIFFLIFN